MQGADNNDKDIINCLLRQIELNEDGTINYVQLFDDLKNKDQDWWIQYIATTKTQTKNNIYPSLLDLIKSSIKKKMGEYLEMFPTGISLMLLEISDQTFGKSTLRKAFLKAK